MNANTHIETFELLNKIAEQFDVKYIEIKDFSNLLRVGSENFVVSTPDITFRSHFEISVFPGHDSFSENYLHICSTNYVNERMVDYMKDCVEIPCSYITDDYYDIAANRRPVIIPKDIFYKISKVLKEYQEKRGRINIIMIHYYLNFKVKI